MTDVPYDVRGVLFDLDDTLLDHSAAAAAAVRHLVRSVPGWGDDDVCRYGYRGVFGRWRRGDGCCVEGAAGRGGRYVR